ALFVVQEKNYVEQAKEIAVQFKANFLKDSVTNFINEFERNKSDSIEIFDFTVSERQNALAEAMQNAWSVRAIQAILDKTFTSHDTRGMWGYALVTGLDEQIEASLNMPEDWDRTARSLDSIFCSWREIENPVGKFYFGITQDYLYKTMISIVSSKIYNSQFVEETYYWINEIKDYKGGKNYAVRLIHPNPRSSEGMMLSTDMQDAIGDRPYETELEGINKDGEVLSSYYFKKKDSDNFARKITYAKLYKPYNWVVCMGSYYDDIYDYVETLKKMKGKSLTRFIFPFALLLDLAFVFMIASYIYNERKSKTAAQKQLNRDHLTDASSKEFGERELKKRFAEYKTSKESPAIMVMDLDNFKTLNDAYGHESGDFVLAQVASLFYDQSRSSDIIIRWDGDKFVGIFQGMQKNVCWNYAQKLLESISQKKIQYKDKTISTSASMGFSFFQQNDKSYEQALERAEKALKEAKNAGKNRARVD
ncbi:MAG: sensor domain-containing diguanylate cyclase, partial [Treponema sp.]|nr:sensor domain-containing diguanylate cyclase [Treponema sp.]